MLERILLGSYTKKDSQGIYEIYLDTNQKKLVHAKELIKEDNPTYLGFSKNKVIYSVTKVDGNGGVAAYQETPEGSFTLLNTVTEEGAPPCYIGIDEERQLVYGANYHKGEVTVYKILANGALEKTDAVTHKGSGPNENQGSAHAHYADVTPDGRLVVCDLGTDEVFTYDVSLEGKLSEVAKYVADPGTGPRHITFHPNKKIAYLFGELASTLVVLNYDEKTGAFQHLSTQSTLPTDYDGFNGGAAIRISSDGKFVYVSNRGHNSIAVFAISEAGKKADIIQFISTEGDFPRDFSLNSTEEFVVAANQNTDNLTLYSREKETGLLSLIEKDVAVPECVCVYFV